MQNEKVNAEIDETAKAYFESLKKYESLTKSEEHELLRRYKLNNDIEARNKVVQSNLKYVVKLASAYRGRGVPYMDLISEANSGLVESIDKFDLSKNVKLLSYSKWWIMQRMQNAIEKYNKLPISEIPEEYEFDYESEEDGIVHKFSKRKESSTFMFEEDNEVEKNDKVAFLDTICSVLDDRERDMINMYYGRGYSKEHTLEDISEKYGLTKERVRQIIETSFKKIRSEALVVEDIQIQK